MVYFGSLIMFFVCICEYFTHTHWVSVLALPFLPDVMHCRRIRTIVCVCECVFLGYSNLLTSGGYCVCVCIKVIYSNMTVVLMAGKRRWQKTEPTSKT